MTVIVGYARTSTVEQQAGFLAQQRDLEARGCEKVYAEQISSVAGKRPKLEEALGFIREGDVFMVTRLDRLARSVKDLLTIVEKIEERGARLQILDMALDTGTATGKLLLTMIGSIAEFERNILLERQKEGIAKAHAEGKYKGRVSQPVLDRLDEITALYGQGVGPQAIAKKLSVHRSSVWRVLRSMRQEHGSGDSRAPQ